MKIQVAKGRAHWHWCARDADGEILCSSRTFDSKNAAIEAADEFLDEFGCMTLEITELTPKLFNINWGHR